MRSKIAHNAEIDALHHLLEERERPIAHMDGAIRDLRDRLDASETERRQLSERVHGLLTYRQTGSVPSAGSAGVTEAKVPWWRRRFR